MKRQFKKPHWLNLVLVALMQFGGAALIANPANAQQPSNEVSLSNCPQGLFLSCNGNYAENNQKSEIGSFAAQWIWPNGLFQFDAGNGLFQDLGTNLIPALHSEGIPRVLHDDHMLYGYYYNYLPGQNTPVAGSQALMPASDFLLDFPGTQALQYNYPDQAHGEDMSQPDVLTDFEKILAESAREGFNEYDIDDTVWPGQNNTGTVDPFGYGPATVSQFHTYLNWPSDPTDAGLVLNTAAGNTQTYHFWSWLALYTNVSFTPSMANCASWSAFQPVYYNPSSVNFFLFNALCHYSLLEFLQKSGVYAATKGMMLTVMPNGPGEVNGVDNYGMARLNEVEKLAVESFGVPVPDYHGNEYLTLNAQKYGHRITLIGEIGHNGQGPAYEKWDSTYAHYYDETKGTNPIDANNNFLEGGPLWWNLAKSSSLTSEYQRYAAWTGSSLGYLQSCREGSGTPAPKSTVLVNDGAILDQTCGLDLSPVLNSLHCPYDTVALPEFPNYIQNANTVFYSADQSSPQDFSAIKSWITAGSGRTLIMEGLAPFSVSAGMMDWTGLETNPSPLSISGLADAASPFQETLTLPTSMGGEQVSAAWIGLTGGTVLLSSVEGHALVTKINVGSNKILYIGLDVSANNMFDQALVQYVMTQAGLQSEAIAPDTKDIHLYSVPGGNSCVIWDDADIRYNQANVGSPGNTGAGYYQREPVPASAISLLHVSPNTSYTLYDFYNNTNSTQTSSSSGTLTYPCNYSVDIVYYGPTSNAAFLNTIASAQKTRSALEYVDTNSPSGFMPTPAPLPNNTLTPGEIMTDQSSTGGFFQDQYLTTPNGVGRLLSQNDGNQAIYQMPGYTAKWATNTVSGAGFLYMQTDGNLVVYGPNWTPLWGSGTSGNPGAFAQLQNNGNLQVISPSGSVLYSSNVPFATPVCNSVTGLTCTQSGSTVTGVATIVGSSPTGSVQFMLDGVNQGGPITLSGAQASYQFTSLSSGVHYVSASYSGDANNESSFSATVEWSTSLMSAVIPPSCELTPGSVLSAGQSIYSLTGNTMLTVQNSDGNVVLYGMPNYTPIWGTGTSGYPGDRLDMQTDGNLVVYEYGGWNAAWGSGTSGSNGYLELFNNGDLILYNSQGQQLFNY